MCANDTHIPFESYLRIHVRYAFRPIEYLLNQSIIILNISWASVGNRNNEG